MNIGRYIEYLTTKMKVYLNENRYIKDECTVKYILEKHDSDVLIIIMSSCTRPGIKARYNYNRTLKDIKVNKLFILDDFGVDSRGVYYLGKNGDFKIEKTVKSLISKAKSNLNINKTIYVGSSKGGYSALYFGIDDYNSNIIIGAPQYYLGNYLNRVHPHILEYIMGNKNEDSIKVLNELLPTKIKKAYGNKHLNRIFLHYSDAEPTYFEHIGDLVEDIRGSGIEMSLQKLSYTEHNKISEYFPSYLVESLDGIMKE